MSFSNISIDLGAVIGILYALVAVMLIIVLYHLLFIIVDLRKIARRFEDLTQQVEAVILKPLSLADQGVQWVVEYIERRRREQPHHHHAPKKNAE